MALPLPFCRRPLFAIWSFEAMPHWGLVRPPPPGQERKHILVQEDSQGYRGEPQGAEVGICIYRMWENKSCHIRGFFTFICLHGHAITMFDLYKAGNF